VTAVRQALLLSAADGPIEVAVREHARSRRLRLHARDGQVLLTVPPRTPQAAIDWFVAEQRGWIERTLRRQRREASALGLRRPDVVWRLGRPVPLVRLPGARPLAELRFDGDGPRLVVRGPAEAAIDTWYREETRRVAHGIASRESETLGVTVARLRIGDQRSRWGSASARGTISLSWRLLLAPLEVLDYVVVHELCHLRELNHSRRFWALVATARPDYETQKRWLDRHGAELRAWRPADALAG
jgi:predicted metal-dependent hydrolase